MNREYRVPSSGPFRSVPLVVIIDESSASASEALAVSLQDNDRALVVGRRSFGKALIQSPLLLPQGDVVWLTVGRVYAPSGRLIQRDYEEVTAGEYMASAGEAPEMDTLIYRTATGRIVRGGGGVRPDVEISRPVRLPHYWTESLNAGLPLEVATAAAPSIPATVEVWLSESDIWASELLEPYLDRVQSRLQTGGEITTAEADRIARELADLAAGVRWGRAGQERFRLMTDPDIARALEAHRQHTRDYQNSGTGDLQ
jgi:carboxyl-terminal processing protease